MIERQAELTPEIKRLLEQPTAGQVINLAVNLLNEKPSADRILLWNYPPFRRIIQEALNGSDQYRDARQKRLLEVLHARV